GGEETADPDRRRCRHRRGAAEEAPPADPLRCLDPVLFGVRSHFLAILTGLNQDFEGSKSLKEQPPRIGIWLPPRQSSSMPSTGSCGRSAGFSTARIGASSWSGARRPPNTCMAS